MEPSVEAAPILVTYTRIAVYQAVLILSMRTITELAKHALQNVSLAQGLLKYALFVLALDSFIMTPALAPAQET
jgi:hypothetical protein